MRIFLSTVMCLVSIGVSAADDLVVLKSGPRDPAPGKIVHGFLLAECQKHFEIRKAEIEKLKTPADVAARQERLRQKFIEAIGGFPKKTPLNARTVGTLKRDGYQIEKVIFESRPDHHVTANLYIPEGKGPFPGVLMPIGHSQTGKAADYVQRGSILLAKNGFVVLAYDPIGQGERVQLLDQLGRPALKGSTNEHTMCGVGALLTGRCTASFRIWDGIRAIDYLASRAEVDAKRLGCTGCSGGGTLTSYLMALDDRIAAAAPSCYLTTLERLFATIGPQDGEQNIPGQVAFGLDHADFIFLRAPKPTLICAATRDFFDIQGTWSTFREAKRIYGLLGVPERMDLMESDSSHGYPKSHREAVVRFMNRWLRHVDVPVTEGDFPIEKETDLRCTRTGQVLEDLKGKSVFDLNAEVATELSNPRSSLVRMGDEFRKSVSELIGLQPARIGAEVEEVSSEDRNGYRVAKLVYRTQDGVPLPALSFVPAKPKADSPTVIYISDVGKSDLSAPGGPVEGLVKAGRHVVALDLRGYGETAAGGGTKGRPGFFGANYKETVLAVHLNRPLLGQRVFDLLGVVRKLRGKAGVEVIAVGSAAPVALHAAALDESITSLTIENGLLSWDLVARTPVSENQLVNVVPSALKHYDLPDLAATIAPRPLTIRNPHNATGVLAEKSQVDETYKSVRAAYKRANASDKLTITEK